MLWALVHPFPANSSFWKLKPAETRIAFLFWKKIAKICTVSYFHTVSIFLNLSKLPRFPLEQQVSAAGQPRPGKWLACPSLTETNKACACTDSLGFLREIMVNLDLANLFSKACEHQVRAPIYSFKILATGQETARKVGQLYVCQTLLILRTCSCNRCMKYNLLSSWSSLTRVDKGCTPSSSWGLCTVQSAQTK